jgi:ferredoxin-NADP reductase
MKLKLTKKLIEAKGTKSFFFKPEKDFFYLPGQYIYLTLPKLNYPDTRGSTRHFTLSSSPTEKYLLIITTRVRRESGYKKTLDELPMGTELEAEGPNGEFIIDQEIKEPQILIAGGIGITPFRSMIKYKIDKKYRTPIHLIYSNSTTELITYRKELEKWDKQDKTFSLTMTISKPEESKLKWKGLTGRIDKELIEKLIENSKLKIKNCSFWLCGPPAMVSAIEEELSKLNIALNMINSEKFTGY